MHKDKCAVTHTPTHSGHRPPVTNERASSSEEANAEEDVDMAYHRCIYGSKFLQMAQELYHTASCFHLKKPFHLTVDASSNSLQNQIISLLMALSLRLDADSALRSMHMRGKEESSHWQPLTQRLSVNTATSLVDTNDCMVANTCEMDRIECLIGSLLRELMGQGADGNNLQHVFLVLSLAKQCRTAAADVDAYVEQHQEQFISLTAPELLRCADIAMNEGSRCVSVSRSMLQHGIQVLMRSSTPDYPLIGNLYRRLIYLSPSRVQVFLLHFIFLSLICSYLMCVAQCNMMMMWWWWWWCV